MIDRPSAKVNPITVILDDMSEQDEVTGTVVRVSNYGVFIDIGAGVDAFLHRRKMKVNNNIIDSFMILLMNDICDAIWYKNRTELMIII